VFFTVFYLLYIICTALYLLFANKGAHIFYILVPVKWNSAPDCIKPANRWSRGWLSQVSRAYRSWDTHSQKDIELGSGFVLFNYLGSTAVIFDGLCVLCGRF